MKQSWPNVARLAAAQIAVWPDHGPFIEKRLAAADDSQWAFLDRLAGQILQLAGPELTRFAEDYRWTCELLLEEEFHFRRTGRYRLTRFADAAAEIYDRPDIVERYMNGLLLSQIWWPNHTGVLEYYAADYQIHCGPAMGAFNHWVNGTRYENWRNRHVDEIADLLMRGAAGILSDRLMAMTENDEPAAAGVGEGG